MLLSRRSKALLIKQQFARVPWITLNKFRIVAKLKILFYLQPSARDVSAHISRKSAAKCDKHCELQNSVNHKNLECALCFQGSPGSMPASVSNQLVLRIPRSASSVCSCCLQACGALAPLCFRFMPRIVLNPFWQTALALSVAFVCVGILGNLVLWRTASSIFCVGPARPSASRHEVG